MSPLLDTLSTILSDPDLIASSGRYDAATEFKRTQAGFYDCFDKLMAASKSLIAAYHSMLEMHKDCARMINQLLALGQPNSVVVQHIRARRAQIEQDMLEMESIQCETMRSIQLLHDGNQFVIRILRRLKQPEEENQKGCKRKADEMDGESDSGSSEAE